MSLGSHHTVAPGSRLQTFLNAIFGHSAALSSLPFHRSRRPHLPFFPSRVAVLSHFMERPCSVAPFLYASDHRRAVFQDHIEGSNVEAHCSDENTIVPVMVKNLPWCVSPWVGKT